MRSANALSVLVLTVALVVAGCGGGSVAGATTTFAAPEGLSLVAAAGTGSATLAWTPVAGAEGYRAFLGTASGMTPEQVAASPSGRVVRIAGGDTASVAIDGLTAGATYFARVVAFAGLRTSGLSGEVSTVLAPAAPTGVVASARDGAAVVRWTPSFGASTYEVYAAQDAGLTLAGWELLAGARRWTGATTPFDATGLPNDVETFFVVVAVNAGGGSPDSALVSTVPSVLSGAPAPITDLAAADGSGSVQFTWSSAGTDVSYVLYAAEDPSITHGSYAALPGGLRVLDVTSPYVLAGVAPGTTLYAVVTAVRDGVETADSNVASASATAAVSFTPGSSVGVGANPVDLVLADLDGDGLADLVTANHGDGTVSVLAGVGDGHVQWAGDWFVGDGVTSVVAADFDGDGNVDLAVALDGAPSVVVMKGDGAFGFETLGSVDVGGAPSHLRAFDADGDGILDLALSDSANGYVVVLRGDGAAGFAFYDTVWTGTTPTAIAAGDLDGDKVEDDLVVANVADDTLTAAIGDGSGFGYPDAVATGSGPSHVSLYDCNMDGVLDLLVTNTNQNRVECFPGVGDGTYGTPDVYTTGLQPAATATGDFDGDGHPDFVVTNAGDASVTVFRGGASDTFTENQVVTDLPSSPGPVVAADFDGNGLLDLAIASAAGYVTILLGTND